MKRGDRGKKQNQARHSLSLSQAPRLTTQGAAGRAGQQDGGQRPQGAQRMLIVARGACPRELRVFADIPPVVFGLTQADFQPVLPGAAWPCSVAGRTAQVWVSLSRPLSSQMWEEAIALGKELAEQYENEMFDYEQLSKLLVGPSFLLLRELGPPIFPLPPCVRIPCGLRPRPTVASGRRTASSYLPAAPGPRGPSSRLPQRVYMEQC